MTSLRNITPQRQFDLTGRRVLVTGHTGFKGAWLIRWLVRSKADVVGLSLAEPVSRPALFELARLAPTLRMSLAGDVRNAEQLTAAVRDAAPEIIFHLAAQSLVRTSYRSPVDTWTTNVLGTVNVLEAVRATPSVRAVVICTTDKCYENMQRGHPPFRETDPLGGFDPYSSSKASAEIATAAWRRSFFSGSGGAAVATVRAGNVIGGGDFAEDRLIPDLVRNWQEGTTTPIRQPHATRPWQHVLEPLSGYLMLADQLLRTGSDVGEAWNFGPVLSDVKPVEWVASNIAESLPGSRWSVDSAPNPHEASTLALDWSKAHERLGWSPRWNLATTLKHTTSWYRLWVEIVNAGLPVAECEQRIRSLMDADIDAFENEVASPDNDSSTILGTE